MTEPTTSAAPSGTVRADVRQFVCILDNCESFVTWQESREDAIADCTAKAGKPQHVWATGRKLPNAPLQTASGTRASLQADVGTEEI